MTRERTAGVAGSVPLRLEIGHERHRSPHPPRTGAGRLARGGRVRRGRRRSRIRGDRYFHDGGTFEARDGSDLTLVEREALAAVEREHGVELE